MNKKLIICLFAAIGGILQKLRFVLIFPPVPDNATEFDLIMPSTDWKFKDIKCK